MAKLKESKYIGPTLPAGESVQWRINGTEYHGSTGTAKPAASYDQSVYLGDSPPNWRQRLTNGDYAGSDLTGLEYEFVSHDMTEYNVLVVPRPTSPGTAVYEYRYTSAVFATSYSYPPVSYLDSGAPIVEARDQAKSYFLKRLVASQQQFAGGIFLGELREALRMIRSPAQGLRRAVDRWHRGAMKRRIRTARQYQRYSKQKRAFEIKRALGESWLEQSFGWKPLINDIEDGAVALARLNLEDLGVESIVSRGHAEKEHLKPSYSEVAGVGGAKVKYVKMWPMSVDVKLYGKTKATPANPVLMASSLFGFRPESFVPTVWELTPWSFLIDYFANIGEVLEGWSWGRRGLKWSAIDEKRSLDLVLVFGPYMPSTSNNKIHSVVNGHVQTRVTRRLRSAYNGTFTPSVTYRVPGIGSLKWVNIAGLIAARRSERQFRL